MSSAVRWGTSNWKKEVRNQTLRFIMSTEVDNQQDVQSKGVLGGIRRIFTSTPSWWGWSTPARCLIQLHSLRPGSSRRLRDRDFLSGWHGASGSEASCQESGPSHKWRLDNCWCKERRWLTKRIIEEIGFPQVESRMIYPPLNSSRQFYTES